MHDVRTRKPGRQPAGARKQPKHKRGNKPALASAGPPAQSPPAATAPFMLAARPPAFPLDVRVPPHRGAVIALAPKGLMAKPAWPEVPALEPEPTEYLVTPARTPLKRKKTAAPAGKAPAKPVKPTKKVVAAATGIPKARKGKSAGPRPNQVKRDTSAQTLKARPTPSAGLMEGTGPTVAPQSPASAAWPHIPDQADPSQAATATATSDPQSGVPIAARTEHGPPTVLAPAEMTPAAMTPPPVTDAIPLAERIALPPSPRDRALVRQGTGAVARIVAWLTRLLPRKRKTTLPRARTRLDQSPSRSAEPGPTPTASLAAPAEATETTAELARRMLLQLSAENERLRRELEVLRGTQGPTAKG